MDRVGRGGASAGPKPLSRRWSWLKWSLICGQVGFIRPFEGAIPARMITEPGLGDEIKQRRAGDQIRIPDDRQHVRPNEIGMNAFESQKCRSGRIRFSSRSAMLFSMSRQNCGTSISWARRGAK